MIIKGKRINLRPLKNSDAKSIYKNANCPLIERYTVNIPYPYRLEDAKNFIPITSAKMKKREAYELGIELKAENKVIGMMSLINIDWKNKNSEVGYWVGKEYMGKGIGTEALRLMLNFGFKKLKLEKIWAQVFHPNIGSARLLEKCGFMLEGRLRKAYFKNKEWYDRLMYGLLKKEYKT